MKKITALFLIMIALTFLSACDKTDVENELNDAENSEELLTDEEAAILDKESDDFKGDYMEALAEATEDEKLNKDVNLANELMDSTDLKISGKGGKGSCNAIDDSSTCVEYYGSYWKETEMKLNCEGAGTFSMNPCPQDMAGGCNAGSGTPTDLVAWMYLRGGGEIDAESLKYAKLACDNTLASEWISR